MAFTLTGDLHSEILRGGIAYRGSDFRPDNFNS